MADTPRLKRLNGLATSLKSFNGLDERPSRVSPASTILTALTI
jgi:hypothetical protein